LPWVPRPLKNGRDFVAQNGLASRIFDEKDNDALLHLDANVDASAGGRVADRVVGQVPKNSEVQNFRIASDSCHLRRQVDVEFELMLCAEGLDFEGEYLQKNPDVIISHTEVVRLRVDQGFEFLSDELRVLFHGEKRLFLFGVDWPQLFR